MSRAYKLRCTIFGHQNDVRALACLNFPEGAFVSGSRDVTARIWVANVEDHGYREGLVLGGHNGFVSTVCALPADNDFPNGLIVTGCNDHTIRVYTLDSPEPIYQLTGHSDNVCSLFAGKFGTLISGSWDTTARVWLKQKCVMTLKGHEAAVWGVAIMPEGGYMLTGSADKTIKLWKAGKCECTFVGHTDCVRDVVVLIGAEFLSCSNDFTIRRWSAKSRTCLRVYNGHSSFVYKLAVMPNGNDFVSCGEDRTARIWSDGALQQTIAHPSQSIWSVCVLQNGDIVTGGSDGIIRIFTTSQERVASDTELQAYEDDLSASPIPAQIGDIKTEDLVGPSALLSPGTRDGQTIMVRTDTCIEAHQWSESEQRWIKIGNVTGGCSDSQTAPSGVKTHYQGKDYDYVFNVELYEDKPPLKLPYNIGEDPWVAAHNFLENNNMSQMFLDQVANFIQQQTGGITLGSPQLPAVSDPFTGGSRYVPGGAGGEASAPSRTDPTSHYAPEVGVSSTSVSGPETSNGKSYFPETNYIFFDLCNTQPIFGKLREYNTSQAQGSQQLTDCEIKSLEDLVLGRVTTVPEILELLWRLMQWPPDILLPVFDVLRLVLRDPVANELFCNVAGAGSRFVGYLCSVLKSGGSDSVRDKNHLLVVRVLCNAFHHGHGQQLMLQNGERLLVIILALVRQSKDRNLQVACTSFLLNLTIGNIQTASVEGGQHCLLIAFDFAQSLTDAEAKFRLVVAVGTAVQSDQLLMGLARSLGVSEFLRDCQQSDSEKLRLSAQQLHKLL